MKQILFVFLALLIAIPCFSQSQFQPAATVNLTKTEAITVGQLRLEVERLEKLNNRKFSHEEKLKVLDMLINERHLIQAAQRDNIRVTDNEINQFIQQQKMGLSQQLGRQLTDEEYAQVVMSEFGIDVNAYTEQLRRQLLARKYIMNKKGDIINSVAKPTEEEIHSEYILRRTDLVRPETIRFTLIHVPYGPDAASKTKARTLAESLVREINNDPSKFDEVVLRGNTTSSGYSAKDQGYMPRKVEVRQIVGQEFMDIAFNLKQGQISRLIEGLQGYQIIKVTENYNAKQLELNDIIEFGTRITVRDYFGTILYNQKNQEVRDKVTEELVAEIKTNRTFQVFENNIKW